MDTIPTDPHEAARAAGLRYVSGRGKGFTRRRRGSGFSYYSVSGKLIPDGLKRERIEALAIPPAWNNVWICPSSSGHLQASGEDEKGRRQYIYHPLYRAIRDVAKFNRLRDFAASLPRIRRRISRDLALKGLPREKVLAAIVRLIDASYIRIGNEKYRQQNKSYGLTTMLPKHVRIEGDMLRFNFAGKSGKEVDVSVQDKRLARILKRCRELPGKRLFQYRNNGSQGHIGSGDVNEYLHEISGGRFTAKDFRTWGGTTLVAEHLRQLGPASGKTQMRRNINAAIRVAAETLGNTLAVCRKYYVHPAVTAAYKTGALTEKIERGKSCQGPHRVRGLRQLECGVLYIILEHSDEAFREWIENAA